MRTSGDGFNLELVVENIKHLVSLWFVVLPDRGDA